jgi:hypothetical protein
MAANADGYASAHCRTPALFGTLGGKFARGQKARTCAIGHTAHAQARIWLARSLDMERAMTGTGWGESVVRRVVVIGGVTAAVMAALLFAKPLYSAMANTKAPSGSDASQTVADKGRATETASFVISPTVDSDSEFFFGCGDGSNGYYAA